MQFLNTFRAGGVLLKLLTLVVLALGTQSAYAQNCSGAGGTYALTMPAKIVLPRDTVQTGVTRISGWVEGPLVKPWSCADSYGIGSAAHVNGRTAASYTYTESGVTYQVYESGVPGIGYVMYVKPFVGGCGHSGSPWPITKTGQKSAFRAPADYSGYGCNATGRWPYGFSGAVALVRTGPVSLANGNATVAGNVAEARPFIDYGTPNFPGGGNTSSIWTVTSTTFEIAACETPDVEVDLGTHKSSDFGAIGSVTTAVPVNIQLKNCPAGIAAVNYRIEPATTVVNQAQSVVALDGTSTASGVGVQLLTNTGGTPHPLSTTTFRPFPGYNTAGGDFTLTLYSRYYKAAASVTPGEANSLMYFTMQYL